MQTIDEVRDLVDIELLSLIGGYNPEDTKNNLRILEDIRKSCKDMGEGKKPTPEHIAEIGIATNENVQIRDFLMGLRVEEQQVAENSFDYLLYLGSTLKKEICVPIATVFTTYLYEIGQQNVARETLSDILELKPDYGLARLLREFFARGVPQEMMSEMANQLHKEVIKKIQEGDSE